MRVQDLFIFLNKLKEHNTKEWFDAHKTEYQLLRSEFIDFTSIVLENLSRIDDRFSQMQASKCIFRINRDIRFSKNKDPYKTNFGMNLNLTGRKEEFCGFYLHLEPGNSFFAGGIYLPPSSSLQAIRQEIDYNQTEFLEIVESSDFQSNFGSLVGDKLTRPPKGYDINNPMIEYLKLKSFIAERRFNDKELDKEFLLKEILESVKVLMPLNEFILRSISS
ncbi:MAG: DUF2461 domain-containing protein [Bacteroidia bacterium]